MNKDGTNRQNKKPVMYRSLCVGASVLCLALSLTGNVLAQDDDFFTPPQAESKERSNEVPKTDVESLIDRLSAQDQTTPNETIEQPENTSDPRYDASSDYWRVEQAQGQKQEQEADDAPETSEDNFAQEFESDVDLSVITVDDEEDFLPDTSMIEQPVVKLRSLDKVTARTETFEAKVGSTVQFGSLYIKPRTCRTASPLNEPESAAFLQIWELDPNKKDEEAQWVFSGWMFASSPGLSAMDHPIYDVWVLECFGNTDTSQDKGEGKAEDVATEPKEEVKEESSE